MMGQGHDYIDTLNANAVNNPGPETATADLQTVSAETD